MYFILTLTTFEGFSGRGNGRDGVLA